MTRLFYERPINDLFKIVDKNVLNEINSYSDIETANPESLTETIMQRFKIHVPVLNSDERKATPVLENRPGSSFPPSSFANPNKLYPAAVVNYSIPYTGNPEIFTAQPNQFTNRTYNVTVDNHFLNFTIDAEYATLDLSDEKIKRVKEIADEIIQWTKSNLELLRQDCANYEIELRNRTLLEIKNKIAIKNKLTDIENKLNQNN